MAIPKEMKDALAAHFKGRDLYDPSKDAEQEVSSFVPEGLNKGGMCGYAGGGQVGDIDLGLAGLLPGASTYDSPEVSGGTATARVPLGVPPAGAQPPIQAGPSILEGVRPLPPAVEPVPQRPAAPPTIAHKAPEAAPAAVPGAGKLSAAEFDDLIRSLTPSTGQKIGQGAMLGLAGLADAISTGVARTNGSNFQKGILDSQQQKRDALANALKAKYEVGIKGKELELAGQKAKEEERAHLASEEETKRAHNLEAGARAAGLAADESKLNVESANGVIDAFEKGSFFGTRPSAAEYQAAKRVLQNAGATTALGAAKPLTATNRSNGQRIVSHDGGRTWRPLQ